MYLLLSLALENTAKHKNCNPKIFSLKLVNIYDCLATIRLIIICHVLTQMCKLKTNVKCHFRFKITGVYPVTWHRVKSHWSFICREIWHIPAFLLDNVQGEHTTYTGCNVSPLTVLLECNSEVLKELSTLKKKFIFTKFICYLQGNIIRKQGSNSFTLFNNDNESILFCLHNIFVKTTT